ncbi:MAG TPA: aminoglycoside phosphotransferase family protein [Chloroflexota bacterium]|nr:aminoglycoside phosphotransferase family protein [Chloroflexota bacterium]
MSETTFETTLTPIARTAGIEQDRVLRFVQSHVPDCREVVQLEMQPLVGGLRAATVRVEAHYVDTRDRLRVFVFVAKKLDGAMRREAAIYQALSARFIDRPERTTSSGVAPLPLPRLLGVDESRDCYLYLECVSSSDIWPWHNVETTGAVLDALADLHNHPPTADLGPVLAQWDYDAELQASAQSTLELFDTLTYLRNTDLAPRGLWGRGRALRRVVESLPAIRRCLRETTSLHASALHGDVHPGNILLCHAEYPCKQQRPRSTPAPRVVLLDWERARLGSPLEDVCSWLQSLSYWEPEARRRHDTLLRRYLRARGYSDVLSRQLRDLYWLAGACNALSGALRYHLAVASGWNDPSPDQRDAAFRAAADCLRVIRRADACWHT